MPTFVPAPVPQQRAHIATVMQVADAGVGAPAAARHDAIIRSSWQRCVHEHRLDPTRMQEAVILPHARLREHREQMDDFLSIARHGLEALYGQVAGQGYVVLLTDARGVTVDFIGDLTLEPHLRRAGLYLGADWSEHHAGTCGVGTCLSTGQALTVHLDDHFDATHIPLTCTAAPVHDAQGRLQAVLDISQLSSGLPKESQHLALQLVKVYAQHVENAAFLQRHRHDWVLRLSDAPQFLAVNPEHLIALDERGRVIGHNRRAQALFAPGGPAQAASLGRPSPLIGQPLTRLLDLPLEELGRHVQGRAAEPRAVQRHGSTQRLYLLASPPPARTGARSATLPSSDAPPSRTEAPLTSTEPSRSLGAPEAAASPSLPAPLAALSAGDPALERQLARAARLADSAVSVLITGETGSGKEWFAQALHAAGARRGGPFVAVNCAAIPEALIESELFGHLPGSFSGAGPKGQKGLVQAADGGTLFLDEIGDMPRALQARLLRVLAEREVLPVGATRPVRVDIRVIAATHGALDALVRTGGFREDLYHRLNGVRIQLPPLRERRDLDGLIARMLAPAAAPSDGARRAMLSPEARAALHAHRWPGNLRELRNALDGARALCSDGVIRLDDLPEAIAATLTPPSPATALSIDAPDPAVWRAPPALNAASTLRSTAVGAPPDDAAETLRRALQAAHWNVSAVARDLGCSRMTLYRRMKRLGVRSPLA